MKNNTPLKKSFILYCDQSNIVNKLTDEQAGILVKLIYTYSCDNRLAMVIDDPLIDIVFEAIKTALDRDHDKYLKIVERNKANGRLGGRPKEPKKPSGLSGNPKNPS